MTDVNAVTDFGTMRLYFIRDRKAQSCRLFGGYRTDVEAKRMFYALMDDQRPDNFYRVYPGDYELICTGEFDIELAQLDAFIVPDLICRGDDVN